MLYAHKYVFMQRIRILSSTLVEYSTFNVYLYGK